MRGLFGFGARATRTPLPPRDAYALWAATYPPGPHNPLMQAEQAIVAPIITSIAARRALDVGTGSGRYLPLLASTGARMVVGVDFSMAMLRAGHAPRGVQSDARQEPDATSDSVSRVCGDAYRLPFADASFDLISSSLMAGDIADLRRWLGELARVLATGGELIYSDFHPSWATERWRRTFRAADGRSYDVAYFPHAIDEHLAVLAEHAMDVRGVREPRLAPPARVTWPGWGRPRDVPVAVVFHAVKSVAARM